MNGLLWTEVECTRGERTDFSITPRRKVFGRNQARSKTYWVASRIHLCLLCNYNWRWKTRYIAALVHQQERLPEVNMECHFRKSWAWQTLFAWTYPEYSASFFHCEHFPGLMRHGDDRRHICPDSNLKEVNLNLLLENNTGTRNISS